MHIYNSYNSLPRIETHGDADTEILIGYFLIILSTALIYTYMYIGINRRLRAVDCAATRITPGIPRMALNVNLIQSVTH